MKSAEQKLKKRKHDEQKGVSGHIPNWPETFLEFVRICQLQGKGGAKREKSLTSLSATCFLFGNRKSRNKILVCKDTIEGCNSMIEYCHNERYMMKEVCEKTCGFCGLFAFMTVCLLCAIFI